MKTVMKTESDAPPKPPLVLLTGFLGAGKTTTLNRVLGRQLRLRVGVIINELGRIDIDTRLIKSRAGDVMELAGGCVCHEVRVQSELWAAIEEVKRRSRPEVVVLETTGIAEPPALIAGLARLPDGLVDRIVPAGVVCVVDAEVAGAVLDRHEEARVQVSCADRVLLSKLDRASGDQLAAAHRAVATLNRDAERASFPAGAAGDRALADFVLARATARPAPETGHAHRHGQLSAACFSDTAPMVADLVLAAVEAMRGSLVRVKGFVHVADEPRRGILELAGAQLSLRHGTPWATDPPRTELVFIGDGIDDALVARRLWACRSSQ